MTIDDFTWLVFIANLKIAGWCALGALTIGLIVRLVRWAIR